jgi:hypothetical protein
MPLPKEVTFVTFDVYGTLIDWETGAYDAFSKEAEKDGYTLSREELVPLFLETQQEIKGGSYELYAEVLRRTAVQISRQLGWPLEPSRSGFLPESVSAGRRSRRPTRSSSASQEVRARPDLEHRRQAARRDPPALQVRLRPRGHRPAGALLQAGPAHFKEASAGSAPRRAGCTSRRRTTTTSSRASRPRSP